MENALIYKFQSGFLPGHSTTHQLIEHINVIFMALDYRELICLIFCDVSKAFDRVWLRIRSGPTALLGSSNEIISIISCSTTVMSVKVLGHRRQSLVMVCFRLADQLWNRNNR
jgi:hypothetical protein